MDGEGDAGVAHAHHVLCDARQREAVVLTRHVHQCQVDGMYVGPIQICLKPQQKVNNQTVAARVTVAQPQRASEAKGKLRRGQRPFQGESLATGQALSRGQRRPCSRALLSERWHYTHFTGEETKRRRGFLARLRSSWLENPVPGWDPSLRVSSWKATNFPSSSFSRLLLLFMI